MTKDYCWTAYGERVILSPSQSNLLAGFFVALSPIAIISNALLIWSLFRSKALFQSKRCRMNWIILCVSISDIIIGIVTMPLISVLFTEYQFIRFCSLEKVTVFVGVLMNHFTVYNLFFIGLEQYLRLDPRIRSKNIQVANWLSSNKGLSFIVLTSLILSVIHAILSTLDLESRLIPDAINGVLNFALYVICFVFYLAMYLKVRKSSIRTHTALNLNVTSKTVGIPKYLPKLTRLVYLLLLSSCVCYLPFLLIELAFAYRKFIQRKPITQTLRFINFLTWLPVLFYATLNAMITIYFKVNLRRYVMEKVFSFKAERHEQTAADESRTAMKIKSTQGKSHPV